MHIKVTFIDPETGKPVTTEPFNMEVPAVLWSCMEEDRRKKYCVREFFSSTIVEYEEVD